MSARSVLPGCWRVLSHFGVPTGQRARCIVAVALVAMMMLAVPASGQDQRPAPDHPRLFEAFDDVPALRKKFNDPRFAAFKETLLADADKLLDYQGQNPQPGKDIGVGYRAYKLAAQQRKRVLPALGWSYLLTGEEKYRDLLLLTLPHIFKTPFNPKSFQSEFDVTRFGGPAAVVYDMLYDELDEEMRRDYGKWLDSFLNLRAKPSWGWNNNIGAVYWSSVGIVALARLDAHPDARQILDKCVANLKPFYRHSIEPHPDSGYPEGPLYRNFALFWLLMFVDAYEHVTGDTEHGLLDEPFFRNAPRYIQTMLGGDGVWLTFNDSQPRNYGGPWSAYLGARHDQPTLRWFADHVLNGPSPNGESHDAVFTFLWRDAKPAEFPGLPTLSTLPSLNIAALRSDKTLKPGLMLAVRGRGPVEHGHNQPDTGSFVLYANGENVLIDPGYYQPEPEKHNLLIVDGQAPTRRKQAPVTAGEAGALRWTTVDATAAYEGVERVHRHFVMVADEAVIVLDDVAGKKVTTHLQTAHAPQVQDDKRSAVVEADATALWIGAFGPAVAWGVEGPRDFGRSWVFDDLAEAGRVRWHTMSADYAVDPDKPLVTVCVPIAREADGPPKVAVHHADRRITITLPSTRRISFTKTDKGWTYHNRTR